MSSWSWRFALVVWLAVCGAVAMPLAAGEDLVLALKEPPAERVGRYEGPLRIALGTVSDGTVAMRPGLVGVGPQARYLVLVEGSWPEILRAATERVLGHSGLLADHPDEASHGIDLVLRRGHLSNPGSSVFAEVFIEFTLRHGSEVAGRILTRGVAKRKPLRVSRRTVELVFQEAFEDAFLGLLRSRTFTALVADGWRPAKGSAHRPAGSASASEVLQSVARFQGPKEKRVAEALAAHRASRVVLKEFSVEDPKYTETGDGSAPLGHYLPGLVLEHLRAYHPGVLEAVLWEGEGPVEGDLVVSGQVLRFKKGNLWKKSMIGYGAGKDKLEVAVQLRDGGSDETLVELKRVKSDWGVSGLQQPTQPGFSLTLSGPQSGPVEEMADDLARDLAAFLARHLAPDPGRPPGVELVG